MLAALHRWPGATSGQLADALDVSRSWVEKQRAQFVRAGLYAPWYDLDLRAAGVNAIAVMAGFATSAHDGARAHQVLPHVLAANGVPGIALVEQGHLFVMAMPRSLEGLAGLASSLLEIRAPGGRHPWLARLETSIIPLGEGPVIDYGRLFAGADLPPLEVTRGAPGDRPWPRRHDAATLGHRERAVVRQLVTNPESPVAVACRQAGVPARSFARIKASMLRRGLLRPSSRLNIRRLGHNHVLAVVRRARPLRSASRLLAEARALSPGSAPLVFLASSTDSVTLAPYPTFQAARDAARAVHRWRPPRGTLAAPVTFLFGYESTVRFAYGLAGDLASTWLLAFAQPPSGAPLRRGPAPGTFVERRRGA